MQEVSNNYKGKRTSLNFRKILLIPNKKQWKNWSIPSKLTLIGSYIAIVSFVFTIAIFIITSIDFNRSKTIKELLCGKKWRVDNMAELIYENKDDLPPDIMEKITEFEGEEYDGHQILDFMIKLLESGSYYEFSTDNTYKSVTLFTSTPNKKGVWEYIQLDGNEFIILDSKDTSQLKSLTEDKLVMSDKSGFGNGEKIIDVEWVVK